MYFFAFDIGNIYAQSVVFDVQINDNVAQKSVGEWWVIWAMEQAFLNCD